MSVDPEREPTVEPQDALDPQTEDNDPEDNLGDAGKSQGPGFTNPLTL